MGAGSSARVHARTQLQYGRPAVEARASRAAPLEVSTREAGWRKVTAGAVGARAREMVTGKAEQLSNVLTKGFPPKMMHLSN